VQSLFVTATSTNVGKTYTTQRLIETLSHMGVKVGVCKPIETGVITHPLDATSLLGVCRRYNSDFATLTPKDITAYTFPIPSAPFCADTLSVIEIAKIHDKIAQLSHLCDLLIIEGAGGLMVPITATYDMIDLIADTSSQALLVTPSRLGSINDTRLSMAILEHRAIAYEWCVNLHEDKESFATVTQPYYDHAYPQWWSVQEGLEGYAKRVMGQLWLKS